MMTQEEIKELRLWYLMNTGVGKKYKRKFVAGYLGVDPTAISNWINGKLPLRRDHLKSLKEWKESRDDIRPTEGRVGGTEFWLTNYHSLRRAASLCDIVIPKKEHEAIELLMQQSIPIMPPLKPDVYQSQVLELVSVFDVYKDMYADIWNEWVLSVGYQAQRQSVERNKDGWFDFCPRVLNVYKL